MADLYKIEQLDPHFCGGRSEYWDTPARNINGITAAMELSRVLRELKSRPTRVVLQAPPEPSLPIRWERT